MPARERETETERRRQDPLGVPARDTCIAVSRIGAFVFDREPVMIVSRASLGKIKLPDVRARK